MEKSKIKEAWNWLWNSESWSSYLIFLILIFIIVKFIFLPSLSLIFGTSLPLAIVESSSMDHNILTQINGGYEICGKTLGEGKFLNIDEYWQTCGSWYEQRNITKEQFSSFKLSNGFRKGDIIIIFGEKVENLKVGDILIFQSGQATPIIHRIISLSPLQTKGDHNPTQIGIVPDPRGIDETNIRSNQIIGVAVAKIPYLGWIKLFVFEHKIGSVIILIIFIFIYMVWPSKKEY